MSNEKIIDGRKFLEVFPGNYFEDIEIKPGVYIYYADGNLLKDDTISVVIVANEYINGDYRCFDASQKKIIRIRKDNILTRHAILVPAPEEIKERSFKSLRLHRNQIKHELDDFDWIAAVAEGGEKNDTVKQ